MRIETTYYPTPEDAAVVATELRYGDPEWHYNIAPSGDRWCVRILDENNLFVGFWGTPLK